MRAGASAFMHLFKRLNCFDIAVDTPLPYTFSFLQTQNSLTGLLTDQAEYIKKIKPLPQDTPFSASYSAHSKLELLFHTLPGAHFELSQFVEVTEKT